MNFFWRIRQQGLRLASYTQRWNTTQLLQGDTIYKDITNLLGSSSTTLIITDKTIKKLGLLNELLHTLDAHKKKYFIYDDVKPNPTVKNVDEALQYYKDNNCSKIIAFGGGSPMDCAKIVAARLVKPKQSIEKMQGLLKIRKKIIPIIAIPTTAGTGSETTIAALITDENTHKKYVVTDICLIPPYAALIPELTLSVPPSITAPTGMDALTHAIEAYIGHCNTKQTKRDALQAMLLIKNNLYETYTNGKNSSARKNMLHASFLAGKAFTRAYVGNVHALAHALGGLYNIPHGLANAILLPIVLREYGYTIHCRLASISDYLALLPLESTKEEKAEAVICWIEDINKSMMIPNIIAEIKEEDITLLAERSYKEANPLYPVPVMWNKKQFEKIYKKLKG